MKSEISETKKIIREDHKKPVKKKEKSYPFIKTKKV